ncbi:MAG: PD40 domain-containing protein [Solirubrobacterales bacterium]|nr:PD40 domain-containing protein [Solirubrobacterales bacterium]
MKRGIAVIGAVERLTIVGAAALVALGLGSATAAASGPFSGPNGKIAVDKADGGPMRMGVVSPKGNFRSLYEAPWEDFLDGVTYSPDGSRVAFTYGWRPTSLAVAKPAIGKKWQVPTGKIDVSDPQFVSNGRIVFSGSVYPGGKRPGTYVVRANGTGLHRLFKRKQIATDRNRDRFIAKKGSGYSHRLDLLDRNGRKVRTIASGKSHFFNDAALSPYGRWIVYQQGPAKPHGNYRGNLFVVRRDGTHRRKLTSGNRDKDVTFSPDGGWIAYDRARHGGGYASNIWVTSILHPGKSRQITHSGKKTTYFDVSWGRRQ